MLGVSEARVSRSTFDAIPVGGRSKHYRPRVVLEAAASYRQRSLNEVAGDLVAYAATNAPEHEADVRQEVEDFFATRVTPPIDKERFLDQARRTLPRRLYTQIKRAYEHGSDDVQINFASDAHETSAPARARTAR
jgi:hypothetical protein